MGRRSRRRKFTPNDQSDQRKKAVIQVDARITLPAAVSNFHISPLMVIWSTAKYLAYFMLSLLSVPMRNGLGMGI